ncbi:MAG: hypothetical protein KGL59_03265 [Acidobacteriota bacterium]|nr:hypothetical protein [Acidobacteriota bacterium]
MLSWLNFAPVLLLLLTPVSYAKRLEMVQKDLGKLEKKFAEQKDPVNQAKALAKLLPKEVEHAGILIQAGKVDDGIEVLTHYRGETHRVYEALEATGRNPVKKPQGYMQLQIALRESVRQLSDVVYLVPYERRGPVEAVRADMEQLNARLLQALFPPPSPKAKRKHE